MDTSLLYGYHSAGGNLAMNHHVMLLPVESCYCYWGNLWIVCNLLPLQMQRKKIIWFFFQYWSVPSRELWTGQQCVWDDSSASASGAGDRRKRALWGRQANRSMVQVLSWSGLVKILCGRLPGMCKPSVHNKLLLMSWIGSTLLNPIIQPRAGGGGGGIEAMTVKFV